MCVNCHVTREFTFIDRLCLVIRLISMFKRPKQHINVDRVGNGYKVKGRSLYKCSVSIFNSINAIIRVST